MTKNVTVTNPVQFSVYRRILKTLLDAGLPDDMAKTIAVSARKKSACRFVSYGAFSPDQLRLIHLAYMRELLYLNADKTPIDWQKIIRYDKSMVAFCPDKAWSSVQMWNRLVLMGRNAAHTQAGIELLNL